MVKLRLTAFAFAWVFIAVLGETDLKSAVDLPSWITENPAFHNKTEIDSIKTGNGSITSKENGDKGWLIFLNERSGHGIEVELQKLSLNPDLDDFLLISSWPLISHFKKIKLFTGKFEKPLKKLRIPNTKTFYVLFSASPKTKSPEMVLTYRRYGNSLEVIRPPTDNPAKKKETVFEVQLKGKSPFDYSIPEFLEKLKEGLRASARKYCSVNKISFNETISTEQMVLIHRVSFCPFEWPDRDICASLEHSIFVSGIRNPKDEFILDYELTANHLKKMWKEGSFQELQELGITVFELPSTYDTLVYWCLIISGLMIISLIGTLLFWKANHEDKTGSRQISETFKEIKKAKKPKMKLAKHQRVPSFMFSHGENNQREKFGELVKSPTNEESTLKEKFEDVLKPGDSSELPIRNYLGSILFSSNIAFEDDENDSAVLRAKSTNQ